MKVLLHYVILTLAQTSFQAVEVRNCPTCETEIKLQELTKEFQIHIHVEASKMDQWEKLINQTGDYRIISWEFPYNSTVEKFAYAEISPQEDSILPLNILDVKNAVALRPEAPPCAACHYYIDGTYQTSLSYEKSQDTALIDAVRALITCHKGYFFQ